MKHCDEVQCEHYQTNTEGRPVRTCGKHDFCLLDVVNTLTSLTYRIQTARERLQRDDASKIAYEMRDWPEIYQARLDDLVWTLSQDPYCHKNDVVDLLDDLAKWRTG